YDSHYNFWVFHRSNQGEKRVILSVGILCCSGFSCLCKFFCNVCSRSSVSEDLLHSFYYGNKMTRIYERFFYLGKTWIALRFSINFLHDVRCVKRTFVGNNSCKISHLEWSSGNVSLSHSVKNHLKRIPFSFTIPIVVKISRGNES